MMLMLTFVSHHPSSELDSVSPSLRYMQPSGDEPTLDFLTKSKESRDYLARLEDTDIAEAMILCYIKNVISLFFLFLFFVFSLSTSCGQLL